MPDDAPANLPVPLDRTALERVLARAAELQGAVGDDPEGALTEAQLVEIGREVGIDPAHVRQALAEERTRVVLPDDDGLVGRVAGPAVIVASRVVDGRPAAVVETIDGWMQHEECLQVRRRHPTRMTWEPRSGLLDNIRRSFRVGGRGYALARATEVGATVTPVDERRSLVRLDADLAPARAARVRAGGATAAVGVGAGAAWATVLSLLAPEVAVTLGATGALAAAGVGVGSGYRIARAHRLVVARAQLALEQILDRLQHGELRRAPTMIDLVSSVARRIR